jgi:hypothetical protein
MRPVAAKVRNFAKDVLTKLNSARCLNTLSRGGPLVMTTRFSIYDACNCQQKT